MDRIDEGYQWLEGIADRMKEEIGRGVAASPESLKVRELLWQFGFQRRGDWINKHIRKLMRKFKLRADQDFTATGLDSRMGAALFRRRSREVQEGLRAAWRELLDPAKAG